MGQTEVIIFIIIGNLLLLIFIVGILFFVFQYRKRKLLYEKEKASIEKQHQLEILNTQLASQDQTMQFIGREIHDSVAQKLTLASIYTQKLEYENQYPELTNRLESISSVINDSLNELRDLSRTLTDHNMHDADLHDLVQAECERVNNTGSCRAQLQFTFEGKMSVTVKSFLIRIIQEFMQNSLKHAEGKLIDLVIMNQGNDFRMKATDDGKGFNMSEKKSNGIGLNNMQRRAQLIGGELKLYSEPGKGTSLEIIIPEQKLMSN
jgi:signal transduction histidine kinase